MVQLATRSAALALLAGAALAKAAPECSTGTLPFGTYTVQSAQCQASDVEVGYKIKFACSLWRPICTERTCLRCKDALAEDPATGRPNQALFFEQERREHAAGALTTLDQVPDFGKESAENPFLQGDLLGNLINLLKAKSLASFLDSFSIAATFTGAFVSTVSSNALFPLTNFVDGFRAGETLEDRWNRPVPGERVGVTSFAAVVQDMGLDFTDAHPFFARYYTGKRVPSWEDNASHKAAISLLDLGMGAARGIGIEPIETLYALEPRFAFDSEGLVKATWDGFAFMGAREIKYASNGVHGIAVVERYGDEDTLGILMSDSVFAAHLVYSDATNEYEIDLTRLERYTPLAGYAALGGRASFKLGVDGRLHTTMLEYGGKSFGAAAFADPAVREAFQRSELVGWRFAEKAIIASLLALTNLVVHVKDLHLELAAAFQAVTVDSFADDVDHPLSRLLQPFTHRAIQATNDNFKLLFEYKAAEFSLAPLPNAEQLRLIADFIEEKPLRLVDLDMANYASDRNMPPAALGKDGFWTWHYRVAKVQDLYESLINCHLDANFADEGALLADQTLQAWWAAMYVHVPALQRTTGAWADPVLSRVGLVNVLKVLFTWLSWVHEDVGHSAAAYVYNPVHTPMAVPADGRGVPFKMVSFNAAAYRGFVFLNRAKLLDAAPSFWFDDSASDRQCFTAFQGALAALGSSDPAFANCDDRGFYSCVDRVETGVSS